MLYLQNRCMKETVGDYEVSVAFETHGFGYVAIFHSETNENVTAIAFDISDKAQADLVEATIGTLTFAKHWCNWMTIE